MRTVWEDDAEDRAVTAPVSLIVSAFAPCGDVQQTLTPVLASREDTVLLLVDLGRGRDRIGGSVLAQVWQQMGRMAPDVEADDLLALVSLMTKAREKGWILAYHDRSDGGLLVTLLEMAFASRCGLQVDLDIAPEQANARLFSEEVGVVIQVANDHVSELMSLAASLGLDDAIGPVATIRQDERIVVNTPQFELIDSRRGALQSLWSETSHAIARARDNADCADQEFEAIQAADPGLSAALSFDCDDDVAAPFIASGVRPKVAILR